MLHLYALTEHPVTLPDGGSLDVAPLTAVQIEGRLDAVVGEAFEAGGEPTEAAILAHARVVEALAAHNDAVLPARFGRGLLGEAELVEQITSRIPELIAALRRVRGCVEVGLRVLGGTTENDAAVPRSGREYMRDRLEEVRKAERLAAELHESLAALARESSQRVLASPQLLLTAAYLVARGDVESFRAAVASAERERPGLTFVCTGPWPPYSFALLEAQKQ
jgi:hypothetical protein